LRKRRQMKVKLLVKVMRLLSAEIVEMSSSSLLVKRHSISRKDSITPLSVARHAKMPRKDVWKVEEEEAVVVAEEEEVIQEVEEEEFAMPSKEVNATVAMIADSLTVVPVEEEAVEEEEVVVVDVVDHLEAVVEVEEEEFVTPIKRVNATVAHRADILTSNSSFDD
jgi:hypothetical protein